MHVTNDGDHDAEYQCLTGHVILAGQLDQCTDVRVLDEGARIRMCREHGAPIGVKISNTRDGSKPRL